MTTNRHQKDVLNIRGGNIINITYNIIDDYKADITNDDLTKIINYKLYKIIILLENIFKEFES